ncbi:Peroxiredoxin [Desulfobacula phenolica]|uniref:Peroxiredoxin n=2 Tax=Desulfobacula phenolica TaxID=90732 RepID=A0A1H2HX59_9BACT|nr:Peroxiredoxin [Desulfobacula phenolica]
MMDLIKHFLLIKTAFKCQLIIFFLLSWGLIFPGQGGCRAMDKTLDFTLPSPTNETHRIYLGLLNDNRFSLGQIKAEIVIIEIFSMYCPICQREADNVNTMFNLIQNSPVLKQKVKLLGIGSGNSTFEVDFFKNRYSIEFPLFSDPDFSIHKKIGEVRTPHFFGVKIEANGEHTIFYSQSGEVSDPEKFLKTLLTDSGLKQQP